MKTIIAVLLIGLFASCTKEPNKKEYLIEGTYLTVNGKEYLNQTLVMISEGESAIIKSEAQHNITPRLKINITPRLKISANGFIYVNLQGYQNEVLTINFKYQ